MQTATPGRKGTPCIITVLPNTPESRSVLQLSFRALNTLGCTQLDRLFTSMAFIGRGHSKKEAESDAANQALAWFQQLGFTATVSAEAPYDVRTAPHRVLLAGVAQFHTFQPFSFDELMLVPSLRNLLDLEARRLVYDLLIYHYVRPGLLAQHADNVFAHMADGSAGGCAAAAATSASLDASEQALSLHNQEQSHRNRTRNQRETQIPAPLRAGNSPREAHGSREPRQDPGLHPSQTTDHGSTGLDPGPTECAAGPTGLLDPKDRLQQDPDPALPPNADPEPGDPLPPGVSAADSVTSLGGNSNHPHQLSAGDAAAAILRDGGQGRGGLDDGAVNSNRQPGPDGQVSVPAASQPNARRPKAAPSGNPSSGKGPLHFLSEILQSATHGRKGKPCVITVLPDTPDARHVILLSMRPLVGGNTRLNQLLTSKLFVGNGHSRKEAEADAAEQALHFMGQHGLICADAADAQRGARSTTHRALLLAVAQFRTLDPFTLDSIMACPSLRNTTDAETRRKVLELLRQHYVAPGLLTQHADERFSHAAAHAVDGPPGIITRSPAAALPMPRHEQEQLQQLDKGQRQGNSVPQTQTQTQTPPLASSAAHRQHHHTNAPTPAAAAMQDSPPPDDCSSTVSDPRVVTGAPHGADARGPGDRNPKRELGPEGNLAAGSDCGGQGRGDKRRREEGAAGGLGTALMGGDAATLRAARRMVADLLAGALPFPVPLSCIGTMLAPMAQPDGPPPLLQVAGWLATLDDVQECTDGAMVAEHGPCYRAKI
ncbi:MAG: hypothetical protein WDW38_007922 [Sanguina aurantia]